LAPQWQKILIAENAGGLAEAAERIREIFIESGPFYGKQTAADLSSSTFGSTTFGKRKGPEAGSRAGPDLFFELRLLSSYQTPQAEQSSAEEG